MNFLQATSSYESWMRSCATIVVSDLRLKHQQMRRDLFMFFRGTFYGGLNCGPRFAPI